MPDPRQEPIETPYDPTVYEPVRRADQIIFLQHPSLELRIMYWRGRVANLLISRLGYKEITKEEYESNE